MSRRRREQPEPPEQDQPPEPTPDDLPTVEVMPATLVQPDVLPPAAIARLLGRRDVGLPEPRVSARLPRRAGIVLHCTASVRPTSPEHALERVRKIHRVHTAPRRMVEVTDERGTRMVNKGGRGWPAAGYHWAVDEWGNIYQLLGWGLLGRHCKTAPPSLNMSTHGIVLLGKGLETTEAERAAVRWLVEDAEQRFGPQWVIGHGEVSEKECPGPAGRALVQALARPR